MTQENGMEQPVVEVDTQEKEDYSDLIPDFAIRRMARLFLAKMQEEEETE